MTAGAVSAPLIVPIIHLQTRRPKSHVDTDTPVSIQSDTPEVQIFYTLDGQRPEVVQRGAACSSRKYSEPILLPAGRVVVRAVAVTSDGRESSTVTKIFLVEDSDSSRMKENFLLSKEQNPTEEISCSAEDVAGYLKPPESRKVGTISSQSGPHVLHTLLSSRTVNARTGSSHHAHSQDSNLLKQLDTMETSRTSREKDLRCARCVKVHTLDPFSRFCPGCGSTLPVSPEERRPSADEGQVETCVCCNTLVPVNTHTCFMCEESVTQQLQPNTTHTLQDHLVCGCCGSGNPAHISSCLTCESQLPPALCVGTRTPSVLLPCSRCKRANQCDARFCDWCGSKLRHAVSRWTCWKCGASGHPDGFYCTACGVFLNTQAPPTVITPPAEGTISHQVSATSAPDPIPKVKLTAPTAEKSTQTIGLYYPSATQLQREEQQRMLQLSRQQTTSNRQLPLSSISPGRGFWRMQVDHVCAHLRSYAQNNGPFRTLLGEPCMGQMVSAVIQEDLYEVNLTLSFALAGRAQKQGNPAGEADGLTSPWTQTLSSVTERSADSSSLGVMKPSKPKPLVKDDELMKELRPGRGQISIIQQLLDQGADPSSCDGDGQHALATAVVNGHHHVLPVLVQRGADVDQQSGRMKNSALHEAAALGSEGLDCARVLLSCMACVRLKNAGGQTAYDVAVKSGSNDMVSLLAAQTGLDLLGKLGKPKANPYEVKPVDLSGPLP